MTKRLDEIPCPLCGDTGMELIGYASNATAYPSHRGYKLHCKGRGEPHDLRIFVSGMRKDSPYLPKPAEVEPVAEAPRKSRAKELLERASRLTGATA